MIEEFSYQTILSTSGQSVSFFVSSRLFKKEIFQISPFDCLEETKKMILSHLKSPFLSPLFIISFFGKKGDKNLKTVSPFLSHVVYKERPKCFAHSPSQRKNTEKKRNNRN